MLQLSVLRPQVFQTEPEDEEEEGLLRELEEEHADGEEAPQGVPHPPPPHLRLC